MSATLRWNGGRNGWASFIIGFGWMPAPKRRRQMDQWGLHIYLGLWVLTLRGGGSR